MTRLVQQRLWQALLGVIKVVVPSPNILFNYARKFHAGYPPPLHLQTNLFLKERDFNASEPGFNLIMSAWDICRWHSLPADVGPYFVDYWVGPTGHLGDLALDRPPTTTIEFFRPLWHRDLTLWRRDPVPKDFVKSLTKVPAHFTDVLGSGV